MSERTIRHDVQRRDATDEQRSVFRNENAGEPEAYNFDDAGEPEEYDFDDGRPTEAWRLLADQLAPRIERLAAMVEGLRSTPYYVWLADQVHLCDAAGDLRVKVEALKWMFRIAKHMSGDARIMVMATVSKSVDDLEVAAEAQARANAVKVAA
jgi:hypothetical protein